MNTLKFKTDIKCGACIEKVTPFLDTVAGKENWTVDLQSPERLLTVAAPGSAEEIKEALQKAGYTADLL